MLKRSILASTILLLAMACSGGGIGVTPAMPTRDITRICGTMSPPIEKLAPSEGRTLTGRVITESFGRGSGAIGSNYDVRYLTLKGDFGTSRVKLVEDHMYFLAAKYEPEGEDHLLNLARKRFQECESESVEDAVDAIINVGTCLKVVGIQDYDDINSFFTNIDRIYLSNDCN